MGLIIKGYPLNTHYIRCIWGWLLRVPLRLPSQGKVIVPFTSSHFPTQIWSLWYKVMSQIEVKGSLVILLVGWLPRNTFDLLFRWLGVPEIYIYIYVYIYNLPWIFKCQSWSSRLWYAPFGAIPLFRRLHGMTCMEYTFVFPTPPHPGNFTYPAVSAPLFCSHFFFHNPAVSQFFFYPSTVSVLTVLFAHHPAVSLPTVLIIFFTKVGTKSK